MNIDKYRIIHLLSQNKKLSDIAKILKISQPTVSFHIKSLEEELGIQLVETTGKSLTMTKEAISLIPYMGELLSLDEVIRKHAREYQSENVHISIGSTLSPSIYLLPKVIPPFIINHPNTKITIDVDSAKTIKERLLSHQYDFGIISTNAQLPDTLYIKPLFQDSLVFLYPNKLEEQFHSLTDLQFISQLNFIHHSEQSSTRNAVEALLKELQVTPKSCITVNSIEVIKELIKAEAGISILPLSLVQDEITTHQLSSLPINSINAQKSIYLIYHKKTPLSPIVEELIQLLT